MISVAQILTTFFNWCSSKWSPVALFMGALAVMAANLMGIFEKISELISQFDEMASPELAGAALNVSPFGFLNYVLPLDLAIAMFTLWVPFYLACTLYRVIKAHVPTVS